MKTKFTKGEWKTSGLEIRDYKGMIIGQAHKHLPINMPIKEQQANAKLIAAAPDLLEALCEFIEAWEEGMPMDSSMIKTAKQAIKKATE